MRDAGLTGLTLRFRHYSTQTYAQIVAHFPFFSLLLFLFDVIFDNQATLPYTSRVSFVLFFLCRILSIIYKKTASNSFNVV